MRLTGFISFTIGKKWRGPSLILLFLLANHLVIADKKEGISRSCAIHAGRMAKAAYEYSQFSYFINEQKVVSVNIEKALTSINLSLAAIDSAISLAAKDSSSLIGIDYAVVCKQSGNEARRLLKKASREEDVDQKRFYCKKAIFLCGNAIVDAYTASLYLNGSMSNAINNIPAPAAKENKPLTKLEVDKALFNVLSEDLRRKEENLNKEISDLKQKLSTTKNPGEQAKIKKQIQDLEAQLAEVLAKKAEAQAKYGNINDMLEKEEKSRFGKETYSETSVFDKSVKSTFDLKEKQSPGKFESSNDEWGEALLLDQKLPPGLFYKVQVGVYKTKLDPAIFQGLTPITGETTPDGIRYSAGMFTKLKDAQEAKTYINSIGFNDAFVVAFYNGKKIKIAEASKLEK